MRLPLPLLAALTVCLLPLLTGCGPSGQLASYNSTDAIVTVRIGSAEESIAAGETRLLRWRGTPLTIEVLDEAGATLETVEATPAKGDHWLLHHVGGDRCFGVADFGPLYQAGGDGSLTSVTGIGPGSWLVLEHEMAVWPGQKLPIYSEDAVIWGAVEVACAMTVDAANTHLAIQGQLDKLMPK
ncbi:MAG: hypothetical protein QGH45_18680 [Myxococcota bacterium]|jgi:hypothetical protein|nr:hypothetical protein [Myxococcota bacterium]